MNHPSMTSRGRRIAAVIAILGVLALPKHVDCGYPGGECKRTNALRRTCTAYELEPFGFFLIESLVGSDIGFAYSSGEKCT
jgi:hypothetical protein